MTRTKIFISASAVALGAALALAPTTASAQEVCDVAGAPAGTATGGGALACGTGSDATGLHSVAIGYDADATDHGSTAVGYGSDATGYYSVAVGHWAYATASGTTAVGGNANADGLNSTAIGYNADTAGFENSVALGAYTVNTADNQVHVGGRTIVGVTAVTPVAGGNAAATTGQLFTTNQAVAAINAVNATQANQIAALQAQDVVLEQRIDRTERRASGGTAVAIAMGGATFLPGSSFNLTCNVGTYRGRWAGALNIGAMISPNVALNAGVGSGFDSAGKVGARAGFTFGW